MNHRNKLILFLLICIYGCALNAPARLSQDESDEIISSARELLLISTFKITEREKKVIKEKEPEFRYYYLSGPENAQYSIMWSVNKTDTIGITGVGNIFNLEGAEIKRANN